MAREPELVDGIEQIVRSFAFVEKGNRDPVLDHLEEQL
jgi:hypothetical protein